MAELDHKAGGYARQRQLHIQRRENPSHAEWVLRQVVEDKTTIKVVSYEYELVDPDSGRSYWFDVGGMVGNRFVLIDLDLPYKGSGPSSRQKEITQEKEALVEHLNIPTIFFTTSDKAVLWMTLLRFTEVVQQEDQT